MKHQVIAAAALAALIIFCSYMVTRLHADQANHAFQPASELSMNRP